MLHGRYAQYYVLCFMHIRLLYLCICCVIINIQKQVQSHWKFIKKKCVFNIVRKEGEGGEWVVER